MATNTFHILNTGTSYTIETDGEILTSVTINAYQKPAVIHDRPGHPVTLHDIEINIGNTLRGKGSNNAELQAIINKLMHKVAVS